jgi:hypothetical protein
VAVAVHFWAKTAADNGENVPTTMQLPDENVPTTMNAWRKWRKTLQMLK